MSKIDPNYTQAVFLALRNFDAALKAEAVATDAQTAGLNKENCQTAVNALAAALSASPISLTISGS